MTISTHYNSIKSIRCEGRKLSAYGGKGGRLPVGSEEAFRWTIMKQPDGKGGSFLVKREEASRREGRKLPGGKGASF